MMKYFLKSFIWSSVNDYKDDSQFCLMVSYGHPSTIPNEIQQFESGFNNFMVS